MLQRDLRPFQPHSDLRLGLQPLNQGRVPRAKNHKIHLRTRRAIQGVTFLQELVLSIHF